ncbi:MAG: serine/threonine-protein kinase [Polyangiaceae bacterium]
MTTSEARKSERPPAMAESLVGRVLQGKYRPLSIIASGGMGRVYLAEQLPLGRKVALKVLHSQLLMGHDGATAAASFKKRFLLEASILSKLQHSNIVTVFDYGQLDEIDDTYFMVMEYLGGITLADRLRAEPALSVLDVVLIAEQVAKGLREAHKQGVVHRDLKPANVMLVPEDEGIGKVKILDFGLVKLIEGEQSTEITGAGEMLGSPKYMSPEQITGAVRVDQYTDIYSFGVMLYELLVGKAPFEGETPMQVVVAVLNNEPLPVGNVSRDPLPDELALLVRRCMSRRPSDRPATMDEVLASLRECKVALGAISAQHESMQNAPRKIVLSQSGPTSVSGSIAGMETVPLGGLPLTDSARIKPSAPLKEETSKGKNLLIAGAVVLALAAIVGVKLGVLSGSSSTASLPSSQVSAQSSESTPKNLSSTFVYKIESTPSGAEVWEDNALLGQTPLSVSIANEAVRATPRTFTLKLAGHAPIVIQRGPSEDLSPQQIQVSLSPVSVPESASTTASSAAAGPAKPASRPAQVTPVTKPTTTAPSDIHLTR